MRVLLADDDPSCLDSIKMLLEIDGAHSVVAVKSVEEARYHLQRERFDLIVLDYNLRGSPCTIITRELPPDARVIITTATHQRDEVIEAAANIHPLCILRKPFSLDAFLTAVDHCPPRV